MQNPIPMFCRNIENKLMTELKNPSQLEIRKYVDRIQNVFTRNKEQIYVKEGLAFFLAELIRTNYHHVSFSGGSRSEPCQNIVSHFDYLFKIADQVLQQEIEEKKRLQEIEGKKRLQEIEDKKRQQEKLEKIKGDAQKSTQNQAIDNKSYMSSLPKQFYNINPKQQTKSNISGEKPIYDLPPINAGQYPHEIVSIQDGENINSVNQQTTDQQLNVQNNDKEAIVPTIENNKPNGIEDQAQQNQGGQQIDINKVDQKQGEDQKSTQIQQQVQQQEVTQINQPETQNEDPKKQQTTEATSLPNTDPKEKPKAPAGDIPQKVNDIKNQNKEEKMAANDKKQGVQVVQATYHQQSNIPAIQGQTQKQYQVQATALPNKHINEPKVLADKAPQKTDGLKAQNEQKTTKKEDDNQAAQPKANQSAQNPKSVNQDKTTGELQQQTVSKTTTQTANQNIPTKDAAKKAKLADANKKKNEKSDNKKWK